MTCVIQFHQVSKRYKLSLSRPRSFQEMVVHRRVRADFEVFWVLNNVSFDIEMGETVGLVGANGAGKSTVLKLVSRIIEPTSGQVKVNGRIRALLELGAGFHPDLTGRENIYLNGSILGLSRAEVRRKLDDIIAFSELERFIDVPVRHYSSGMYVRLGFSVAVCTEPEVLLLDEVLAVGDQAFQQKCLDRIGGLKRDGVTIVLVSHHLGNIASICERAIWLQDGRMEADGGSAEVVDQYLTFANTHYYQQQRAEHAGTRSQTVRREENNRWGTFQAEITSVRFLDAAGNACREFEAGQPFTVEIRYHAHELIRKPVFGVATYREDGVHVNGTNTSLDRFIIDAIEGGGVVYYRVDHLPLLEGRYQVTAAIYDIGSNHAYDHHHRLYEFAVRQGSDTRGFEGMIRLPSRWQHDAGQSGEDRLAM